MKRLITSQAFSRNKVMVYLMDHAPDVIDHLVKIYVNPKHPSVSHWMDEVYAFMPRVPKIKTIGVPDIKFILDNTYEGYADLIPGFVTNAQQKYGYIGEINIEELNLWIKSYFVWYHSSLNVDGEASRESIRRWIEYYKGEKS